MTTTPAPTPAAMRRPRTVVVAELRAMRADLMTALERWRVGRTVTIRVADATDDDLRDAIAPPGGYAPADPELTRPRRPWEYPEWRVTDWQVLDRELAHLIEQATALRAYAEQQAEALRCTECARELPVTEARAGFTACEHCAKGDVKL